MTLDFLITYMLAKVVEKGKQAVFKQLNDQPPQGKLFPV